MREIENVICNLCGSNSTEAVAPGFKFQMVRCLSCGLIYENPRLAQEKVLEHIRSGGIWQDHKTGVLLKAKQRLFRNNLKRIEKRSVRGRILDIGCGYGTFLKLAFDNGWQAEGIEVSEAAIKHCREAFGLKISRSIQEAQLVDDSFDAVVFWETLDMFYDPLNMLKSSYRILKKKGVIGLRLPNANFHLPVYKFLARTGNKLNIAPCIFHSYSFSSDTISRLLKRVGFKRVKVYVSEFTEGDPYSTGGILGSWGVRAIKIITFYLCKLLYYLSFGKVVLSPSMLVFAVKE